jgi:Ca2+-binding EF-hand superfamily protein
MKLTSIILSLLSTFCVVGIFAEDREKPGRRPGPDGAPPDRPSREELLKKFDQDGDGKLNKEEQAALREEFAKTRGQGGTDRGPRRLPPQILKKFDKDGDGELSEEERGAMREEFAKRRAEVMKKFDKDGDGKLNEKERAAARKEMGQLLRPDGKPGARPPREGRRPGGKPAPKEG